jgi:hypothetical protein
MRCIEDYRRGTFQGLDSVSGIALETASGVTPTAVL